MMKRLLSSIVLVIAVAGCTHSPKPTYYTLSAPPIPVEPTRSNARVMVGPVALADVLDQPKLVVQSSDHEVKLTDYHRWAGSLKSEVGRVISAHLATYLGTSKVWSFSQSTQIDFDYQVLIDVQNLESRPEEFVLLDVLWTIKPKNSRQQTIVGRSVVRETVTGSDMAALVQAQSLAFAKASADIAKAMSPL